VPAPSDPAAVKLATAILAVVALALLTVLPAGPAAASTPCSYAHSLRFTIDAYNSTEVAEVIDKSKIGPHLRSIDTIDLVSGNNLATVNPAQLQAWRQEVVKGLKANDTQIGGGLNFTAHMGGSKSTTSGADFANVNAFVNSSVDTVGFSGLEYDYELSSETGFSWVFSIARTHATRLDSAIDWSHAHDSSNPHMQGIFYPTGKPLGVESVAQYEWNYSQFFATGESFGHDDGETVQTQRYAGVNASWTTNLTVLEREFAPGPGPTVQLTLGSGAGNTVTPPTAANDIDWMCSTFGSSRFISVYVWWGQTNWDEVVQLLTDFGR
jgi:hypothetical protein